MTKRYPSKTLFSGVQWFTRFEPLHPLFTAAEGRTQAEDIRQVAPQREELQMGRT